MISILLKGKLDHLVHIQLMEVFIGCESFFWLGRFGRSFRNGENLSLIDTVPRLSDYKFRNSELFH